MRRVQCHLRLRQCGRSLLSAHTRRFRRRLARLQHGTTRPAHAVAILMPPPTELFSTGAVAEGRQENCDIMFTVEMCPRTRLILVEIMYWLRCHSAGACGAIRY